MYIYQTGQAVFLPSVLATGISPKLDDRNIDRWFNTDAMRILPAFTARRIPFMWNDLRLPTINHWDMSFLKSKFVYKERVKLQFRFEMINALNRTWFGGLDTSPTSGSYGRLTSQANNPRNIQLGMKLTLLDRPPGLSSPHPGRLTSRTQSDASGARKPPALTETESP